MLRAQVGLPYLKAKLDALYSRHSTRVDGVLGLGLARLRQASAAAHPAMRCGRPGRPCAMREACAGGCGRAPSSCLRARLSRMDGLGGLLSAPPPRRQLAGGIHVGDWFTSFCGPHTLRMHAITDLSHACIKRC
jgi:hypothetical protein